MLHDFVSANREEVIKRCRAKVFHRSLPPAMPLELEHGIPKFLEQLVVALREEEANPEWWKENRASADRTHSANSDGKELSAQGYPISEVVHGYGDVCQVITQLAIEMNAPVTVREFQTLNRLLDNAIADAVSSFILHREGPATGDGACDSPQHLGSVAEQQRKQLDAALVALDAIKLGNVGMMGAAGGILEDSVKKLRVLIDRSLPEVRPAPGMAEGVIPLPERRVEHGGRRVGDTQFIGVPTLSK